jgi:hypothetical protein
MSKESKAPDFSNELESFADIESLESEEMWSSRVIDEYSRKESRTVIIKRIDERCSSRKVLNDSLL